MSKRILATLALMVGCGSDTDLEDCEGALGGGAMPPQCESICVDEIAPWPGPACTGHNPVGLDGSMTFQCDSTFTKDGRTGCCGAGDEPNGQLVVRFFGCEGQ